MTARDLPEHSPADTGGSPSKRVSLAGIRSSLRRAYGGDRRRLQREWDRLARQPEGRASGQPPEKELRALQARVERSIRRKTERRQRIPRLSFPPELPITARKDDIVDAIRRHPVVIVAGETGSGKTTQIPKFCLAAGRGVDGMIGCTQPRRIAATSVAARIAEELGEPLGRSVGYKIRFKDRTGGRAYVKVMTDGILLAETQSDRLLRDYDTIIVDEAHERSINIDFILGILKRLLQRRGDLKVIITSATIDTEKFSAAFDDAPVIEVSGRTYPVEVRYHPGSEAASANGDATWVDLAVDAVDGLCRRKERGDILVFMPTERDIRETCESLRGRHPDEAVVLPLFARLSAADQSKVFRSFPRRKIVVATNVAETSITIPGIRYVVDTGLARISRYSPGSRITSLAVSPISRSSADQRMGRCGRVADGVCIRLYPEEDYADRPRFTPPEILRTNLAEVILRMTALGLGDIDDFPFVDRPQEKTVRDGIRLLEELGAIRDRKPAGTSGGSAGTRFELTPRGRLMADLPIDPRLSRVLIEAESLGCREEIGVVVAALCVRDPRERPAEKAAQADQVHARFRDPASDFVSLWNIWESCREATGGEKTAGRLRKFCQTHFLSYIRMREWQDVHDQTLDILREAGEQRGQRRRPRRSPPADAGRKRPRAAAAPPASAEGVHEPRYEAIHRSLLAGFLSNIAVKKEKNLFTAARGRQVTLFPGSTLFNRAGRWIVAAEIVETSRLFARKAAAIDNAWLETIGGDLCRYTWTDPHWERSRGEVVASEQVTLFGLPIVSGRPVSYGHVDPEAAADIFVRSALIEGDMKTPMAFMTHNQRLIDEVETIEHRLRKRDILVDEAYLFDFYRHRLDGVHDIRTLKHRIRKRGGDHFLRIPKEDLYRYRPDEAALSEFPESITLGDREFECVYRYEPGETDDGVTIRIPHQQAPAVPAEGIDWLVPGLYEEKVRSLVKGLPKIHRKRLVPLGETVETIVREMPKGESSLVNSLSDFVHRRFGVDIPASAWPAETLPDHLKARIAITGPGGDEIQTSRDKGILRRGLSQEIPDDDLRHARRQWERSGLTDWQFGDLPESFDIQARGGRRLSVFPALAKSAAPAGSVDLKLFTDRNAAAASHGEGVAALFALRFSKDLKRIQKALVLPAEAGRAVGDFGGPKEFRNALQRRILSDLFRLDIRTQGAFEAHAAAVAPVMASRARDLLERCTSVLEAYHQTGKTLHRLGLQTRSDVCRGELLAGLRNDLVRLVPGNFLELYDGERLGHLPRYVRAIEIRAQRAAVDVEKDRSKSRLLAPAAEALDRLLESLSGGASADKRRAVETYFWLLEEYKVSLFAQELKTAVPVSRKRLEKQLAEAERKV